MSGLLYLIPAALGLGLLGLLLFLWALRNGQFDDLDGAAERILHDDDPADIGADERSRKAACDPVEEFPPASRIGNRANPRK